MVLEEAIILCDYEFKFPFEPPWEDLKLTVDLPGGGHAYVFDTFCKEPPTKEEKAARDARILAIYARSARRQQLEALQKAEGAT